MKFSLFVVALCSIFLLLASCGTEQQLTAITNATANVTDTETGCSLDYNPICGKDSLTYQNTCFSSLRNVAVEYIGNCQYTLCSFNGQEHYLLNNILYYEDDKGRPYINVVYGTFFLQEDGNGWTYVKAINKESSYYTNRMQEYVNGITESGNQINCTTTTDIPEQLKEFLKTHGKILELKIESNEDKKNNTTETSTSTSS